MGNKRLLKKFLLQDAAPLASLLLFLAPLPIQRERPPTLPASDRVPSSLANTFDPRRDCIRTTLDLGRPGGGSPNSARLVLRLPNDPEPLVLPFGSESFFQITVVTPECERVLDQGSRECLSDEAQRLRSDALIPFQASPPTAYCGVRPTGREGCANVRLANSGETIARLNSTSAPIELQSVLSFLRNPVPSETEFQEHIRSRFSDEQRATWEPTRLRTERRNYIQRRVLEGLQELRSRYRVYAAPGTAGREVPFRIQQRSTDRRGVRSEFADVATLTHIRLAPYEGSSVWRNMEPVRAARTILERARTDLTSSRPWGGFLGLSQPEVAILREIEQGARRLSDYWLSGMRLLDQDRPPRVDLSDFEVRDHLSDLGWTAQALAAPESRRVRESLRRLTHSVIEEASLALEGAASIENLLTAASFWWSARAMQIAAGCARPDADSEILIPSLVTEQYDHQQCRRLFASRTYAELNRRIRGGAPLRVTSQEWIVNFALGSRIERAQLYGRAMPIILGQVERDVFPSKQELSMLVQEVLQTREELRTNQSLTWNGLQPLSASQRSAMQEFLLNATRFFQALARQAVRYRLRNPELFQDTRRAWTWVRSALELDTFPLGPTDSRGEEAEVQDALASIRNASPSRLWEVQSALSSSDRLMSAVPQSAQRICDAWLAWITGPGRGAAATPWTERSSACGNAVNLWLALPAEQRIRSAEELSGRCFENSDTLACNTLFSRGGSFTPYSPTQWVQLFRSTPSDQTALLRSWVRLFKAEASSAMRGGPARASRDWRNAITQIHSFLRTRAEAIWRTAPQERELRNCFDAAEWSRHAGEDEIPEAPIVRAAIHPDCRTPDAFIPFWIDTLKICHAARYGTSTESWFAPVETFHFWLLTWNQDMNLLPRDRRSIRPGTATQIYFALNDLFRDARPSEWEDSRFPRRVPIYCVSSESQARIGFAYAERVNNAFSGISSFQVWHRIGFGDETPPPFWQDAANPLVR